MTASEIESSDSDSDSLDPFSNSKTEQGSIELNETR